MNDSREPQIEMNIDDALLALRSATPPAGMEDRLLYSLQRVEQAKELSRERAWRWPAMLALSGTAALILLAGVFSPRWHPSRESSRRVGGAEVSHFPASSTAIQVSATVKTRPAQHFVREHAPHHQVTTSQETLQKASESSFPAPPMPLTEQEKLLLRLMHHSDPVELAQLDTQSLDAAFEAQKTQFNNFFSIRSQEQNDDEPSEN